MKVSIAVIKLVLRTNKVLADGTHPIMLRVSFNGMKERSTGYSCTPRFWDKRNECVKKGYPNFVIVNSELKKQKDEAITKRDRFIASNEVYTPAMILDREEVRNAVTNDFRGLIQRYLDEKCLKSSTADRYWTMFNNVVRFYNKDSILINEINEGFCRRFGRYLENEGIKSGSIRIYLGKIISILHYAVDIGVIDKYPLGTFKYHQEYNESKSELYIHSKTMDVMIEMFLDECIIRDGKLWHYRDGVIEKLMDVHSELYGKYLYIITYYMCGLAPTDISHLKKSDIKVQSIKGNNYYSIDGRRDKTHMTYKIRLLENSLLSNVLIRTMLMFNDSVYFLPTLRGYEDKSESTCICRFKYIYKYHREHLTNWFREVNEEVVKRNVANGDNIELIDLECTYYSARHSYIMKEIQKPNVNLLKIATSVGKSVVSLHQYLTYLNDLDLVD